MSNKRKSYKNIESIKSRIEAGRLKVCLTVRGDDGDPPFAYLPDRELSTLLPRSILLTSLHDVPRELLETIDPMLGRLVKGRQVRTWMYDDRLYASFPTWRSVRFSDI